MQRIKVIYDNFMVWEARPAEWWSGIDNKFDGCLGMRSLDILMTRFMNDDNEGQMDDNG